MKMNRTLDAMRAAGLTQRSMVEELNKMGVAAPRGGKWRLSQLQRVLTRLHQRAYF